jgi:hypothetical protein
VPRPPSLALAALALLLPAAFAQTQIFPLRDIRPGLTGKGRTVFTGAQVEDFDVEILGVLENAGPKQSIILGRLSGGPLTHTGVMQGMSGSPVYIDGKLAGAVAMAFAFSKDPIAGIRPIEEMIAAGNATPANSQRRAALATPATGIPGQPSIDDLLPLHARITHEAGRMTDIATPVSFGGFTQATIDRFTPQLRTLGLEPRQGVLGGGRQPGNTSNSTPLQPGSMISVQLITGDLNVGADGTVTHIDGNKIYAFGHRFLSTGPTEMPFARSEVLALLPNLSTSFKISAAREVLGAITSDHTAAVAGELGRQAKLAPIKMQVNSARNSNYRFEVVNDRFLTPFLVAMAAHSGLDATERAVGVSTIRVRADLRFAGAPPVRSENVWT